MANRHDIAHRFVNMDFGKNGSLKAGNVSCNTKNYYSYSTVFGQWVDKEKKVCIVYQGGTSSSSRKHQLYKGMFPEDVHVFPYDDGGGAGWYRWHGCNLSGYGTFGWHEKKTLMDYWIDVLYNQFSQIENGKTKGLEEINFAYWNFVEELCGLYKDTSVSKWIKTKRIALKKSDKQMWAAKRKMVKLLSNGERDVATITDALFGEGTFQKYWDYCARYRRQAKKKAQMEWLCNRLHIRYPYGRDWSSKRIGHDMSAAEIRKMTAKQRNEIHFAALAKIEYNKHNGEREKKYSNGFRNAYKWIVGVEPPQKIWGGYEGSVNQNVTNKNTGKVYECSGERDFFYCFDWACTFVRFDYDDFRHSENKEQWIENFYKECECAEIMRKACTIFERINANYKDALYGHKKFLNDDHLRENTTDDEYEVCMRYIAMQDKYYADQEARRRADEIRRMREKEERERERIFQEQVKREQINTLISEGTEGCRNLWRNHFMSIGDAKNKFDETIFADEDFYNGGNVLMRFNLNKDVVETSMHIRINVPTCKRMWKLVKVWHEDPSKFRELEIKTLSGTYTIISYKDDILTAGCHKISYTEMERMYNEIISNEKTA